ncbi:aldehyde dehydrogenase family protein [Aliiglaciecola sp. SL4]|uniref:aldehyde dehydrogenase family protein n=1 Tax=Aliiglaciecola sp. SL4 TaxID=3239806 RepID=UPI00355C47BB
MKQTVQPNIPATKAFLKIKERQLLIDNQWINGSTEEMIDSIDPATEQVLARIVSAQPEDVDHAVSSSRLALTQGAWPVMAPSERSRLLWKLADLIEENIDELAELETLDQGKPLYVGRWAEIPGAVEQFRYFAGAATKIEGSTIPTSINYQPEGKKIFAYTRKEPIGVVAAIVPWNSPLVLTAMKLAPALAAGCTVVLKPAEDTSLTALRLGELIIEAGFPPGVVNIITGYGAIAGKALASHMDVDKVIFTGSTETGRSILDSAKSNLKKVSIELGGKSPVILMDDANLDLAIPGAANAIFFNGGQVCVAGSRLYAHSKIYDQVVEKVADIAKGMKLGHGLLPSTQMGPLVNKRQVEQVNNFILTAEAEGGSLVTGGKRLDCPGFFIEPTVIANARQDMQIVREEVFGPVLVCQKFDDIEEVTELANDSKFGLAASVWTESLSTAHRMADDIHTGTVWINCHSMFDASLPIGGIKQSGWGQDCGMQALSKYLEVKTVCAVI